MRLRLIDQQQLTLGPVVLGTNWVTVSPRTYTRTVDWEGHLTNPGTAFSSLLNFVGETGWVGLEDKDEDLRTV